MVTPANEGQARELAPLIDEPDQLQEAWAEVVELHAETVYMSPGESGSCSSPKLVLESVTRKGFGEGVHEPFLNALRPLAEHHEGLLRHDETSTGVVVSVVARLTSLEVARLQQCG